MVNAHLHLQHGETRPTMPSAHTCTCMKIRRECYLSRVLQLRTVTYTLSYSPTHSACTKQYHNNLTSTETQRRVHIPSTPSISSAATHYNPTHSHWRIHLPRVRRRCSHQPSAHDQSYSLTPGTARKDRHSAHTTSISSAHMCVRAYVVMCC